MTSEEWRTFFTIASRNLRETLKSEALEAMASDAPIHRSTYCAWTTFERLGFHTIYWNSGLPDEDDLRQDGLRDGCAWGQPFLYAEIAHVLVPASFLEEYHRNHTYIQWTHTQDINGLSRLLENAKIPHLLHATFLELRLY